MRRTLPQLNFFGRLALAIVSSTLGGRVLAAQAAPDKPRLAIISPAHPTDSRGETVYEVQGDSQRDVPVVPGVLVNPTPAKMSQPKYSRKLKKDKFSGDVEVLAVVTPTGEIIDPTISSSANEEASACAIASLGKSRMHPATLDGKPIASLMKVVVHFQIL